VGTATCSPVSFLGLALPLRLIESNLRMLVDIEQMKSSLIYDGSSIPHLRPPPELNTCQSLQFHLERGKVPWYPHPGMLLLALTPEDHW
jgi:hypothetical protein